jgi:hypothetical protein
MLETRGFDAVSITALHPPQGPSLDVPDDGGSIVSRMAELLNRHFFTGEDFVAIGHRPAAAEPELVAADADAGQVGR